jgi:hypothetical protein
LIKDFLFPVPDDLYKNREKRMPFDAALVSLAVAAVFVAFAAVLFWADSRTKASNLTDAPPQKRRSF